MSRSLPPILLAVVLLTSSCSWVFVTGPAEDPQDLECTTNNAAPVVDVVFSALYVATVLVGVSLCQVQGSTQTGEPDKPCSVGARVSLGATAVLAVGHGFSAFQGFRDTKRCRHRRAGQ